MNVQFGMICPLGHQKNDILVGDVTKPKCSICGSEMIPDKDGQISTANATCKNCGAFFGLINSTVCPMCNKTF
jgi:hypothetical protein